MELSTVFDLGLCVRRPNSRYEGVHGHQNNHAQITRREIHGNKNIVC